MVKEGSNRAENVVSIIQKDFCLFRLQLIFSCIFFFFLVSSIFRSEMSIVPASRNFNYFIFPTLQHLCLCVNIFSLKNYNNYWSQFIETTFSIVLLPTELSDNVLNLLVKEKRKMTNKCPSWIIFIRPSFIKKISFVKID